MKRTFTIPFGRIAELTERSDAELLLLKPGTSLFSDWTCIRFASRTALEAFNRKAGLKPVVYTVVDKNCVVWKHQIERQ